jgi:hypothetical protein
MTGRLRQRHALTQDVRGDSRVFHDLGLRGVDAIDFLAEVAARYAVSWDGFDFDRYFKGEYYSPVDLWNRLRRRPDTSKRPLTVDHLVEVCQRKAWFDPAAR